MKRGAIFLLLVVPLVSAAAAIPCGAAPLMVEKNLFSQDRKPPSPESAAAAPQTNKPSLSPKAFQLDGIIIYGDTRKALVRMKGGGALPGKEKGQSPYVVVSEGGQVGDYRVTKVELKSITLEKDGQSIVVSLFSEGKVSPPVPAVPAPYNPPAGGQAPPGMPTPGRGRGPGPPMPGAPPGPRNPDGSPAVNMNAPGTEGVNPAASAQTEQQEPGSGDGNAQEEEAQGTEEPSEGEGP